MGKINAIPINSIREQVSADEWQTRVELAACYRLMARYGMTDLIYNHITARIPGTDNEILINPYGFLYEEITASCLLKVNLAGDILLQPDHGYGISAAGYVIHSAVHSARHDVPCVIHTHSRAACAVAAMECGLLPISQSSMRFYGAVSYHEFEGPALKVEECDRLVADLGSTNVMILCNHGLLVCGRSIPDAFNRIFFVEGACKIQVDAMASGQHLKTPSPQVAEITADVFRSGEAKYNPQHGSNTFDGSLEWGAMLRLLDRCDPGYSE